MARVIVALSMSYIGEWLKLLLLLARVYLCMASGISALSMCTHIRMTCPVVVFACVVTF